ncbi:CHRD domain-containing protein [Catenovulum agarivorans]|uniref:CHRD domain-containing protein n=1 Tax=Catenovulum agarivorans TaxID=1172192 RepID=UPI00030E6AD1|nr:CHRD domain-containing protein [Catenovulum agarivorans]
MNATTNWQSIQWFRMLIAALFLTSLMACNISINTDDDDDDDPHHDEYITLMVKLDGHQENPMVDTDAWGWGEIKIDEDDMMIKGMITIYNLTPDAAHLHVGVAGTNGGVIVGLNQSSDSADIWELQDTTLSADELAAVLNGKTYINFHTSAHPSGEIRGQVLPHHIEISDFKLMGMYEVPVVDTQAMGYGWATVDHEMETLEVHVTTMDLDNATAAHIHQGYAGVNGDVVVGLTQDSADMNHWSVMTDLDQTNSDLLHMGQLYVNVHSSDFAGGEIRGQITIGKTHVLYTELTGDQEVPAVTTDHSGLASLTIMEKDDGGADLVLYVHTDVDDATMAHIHAGLLGVNGGVVLGLVQDTSNLMNFSLMDSFTAEQLMAFLDDEYYINVHSTTQASGELRGQLMPDDDDMHDMNGDGSGNGSMNY